MPDAARPYRPCALDGGLAAVCPVIAPSLDKGFSVLHGPAPYDSAESRR